MNSTPKATTSSARASASTGMRKKNTLKALSLNINSLRGKFFDLCALISSLHFPHVVAVQETKIDDSVQQSFEIPNYKFIPCNRTAHGGGLCLFINNSLHPIPFKVEATANAEIQAIKFTFNKQSFAIINCYKPPKADSNIFVDVLTNTISHVSASVEHVFVCGDVNLCHLLPESHTMITALDSFDLVQLVQSTTHANKLIDVFYAPESLKEFSTISILSPLEKFHTPILAEFDLPAAEKTNNISQKNSASVQRRDWSKADWLLIIQFIFSMNVPLLIKNSKSAQEAVANVHCVFSYAIENFVPLKVVKPDKRIWPKFFTYEIILIVQAKNIAYRVFKSTGIRFFLDKHNRLRKVYRKKLAISKNNFFTESLETVSNSAKFWSTIRTFVSSKSSAISSVTDLAGVTWTEASDMVSCFSVYFSEQFNKTVFAPINNNNTNSFTIPRCEIDFIVQCFDKLKPKLSFGTDGVPALFIKRCAPATIPIICALINKLVYFRAYPSAWKSAVVTVLPKVSNATLVNQFRPISVLPAISKLYEWFILHHLRKLTLSSIHPLQYGFIGGRGTNDCVYSVVHTIYQVLNNFPTASILSLDVSKAFDRVVHAKLLDILSNHGIDGSLYDIISAFLSERTQSVRINNNYSHCVPVTSGVPQGSILGPYLFLLYFNDVLVQLNSATIFGYADDLLLISPLHNQLHFRNLQVDIDLVCTFLNNARHLDLNATKSQLLYIKRSSSSAAPFPGSLSINGSPIVPVVNLKYLGVIFDTYLTFHDHIIGKCSLVKRHVAACMRIFRKSISLESRLIIYKCLLRCHLMYCIEAVYPSRDTDRVFVERTQKFCVRYITNSWSRDTSYDQLLSICNIDPIWYTAGLNRLCLLYRYATGLRNGLDIHFVGNSVVRRSSRATTRTVGSIVNRHRLQIDYPFSSLTLFTKSPHISTIKAFNLLADNIIGLASTDGEEAFILFKNALTIDFITDLLNNHSINFTKLCNP